MFKRFLIAPDSFKGTMSAKEICAIIEKAVKLIVPDAQICLLPMSDGGEGMTESYLELLGGERAGAPVCGPDGRQVMAEYGILPDGTGVAEMASAAGLTLVYGKKDPFTATTRGVGELLKAMRARGVRRVLLGLGGSATNDCGIGMAGALGWRFLGADGRELEPTAQNMEKIEHILRPDEELGMDVTAACDVNNPLFGADGATYTFGRQKGAERETLAALERGVIHLAGVIRRELGMDAAFIEGAGAAGGMGAAVPVFLGGTLKPGAELLMDAANFDGMLKQADIVITGEGRLDGQSAHGKVPVGVGMRAKKMGVPCIALCGSVGKGADEVYAHGISAAFSAVNRPADMEEIKRTCRDDLASLADSVVRLLILGSG